MPVLTQKQIQYGFDYFHADEPQPRAVVEVSEYQGETALCINCTQLGGIFTPQYTTQSQKRRVVQDWCTFLQEHPDAFEELTFGTRLPQELFDAACRQRRLKSLYIKWGVYPDLSGLAALENLELLHLGSGAGVQSIAPIGLLPKLVALSVENFQKIGDYSALTALQNLESLSIMGDGLGPQYIRVDSLEFLRGMPQLRFFRFLTARLTSKDMTPVLDLVHAEHLTLPSSRETSAIHERILALPKLKYGMVVTHPELYRR